MADPDDFCYPLNQTEWEEEDEEEEERHAKQMAALLAVVLLVGAEENREIASTLRNPHRRYLRRQNLLPNPRDTTPWLALLESRDDRAFITTMGFDVATFNLILDSGFRDCWDAMPIARSDVRSSGAPKIHRRSLDAAGGLGLALHYLTTSMREVGLQQIFALVPSTVNRYLLFSLPLLLCTVKKMELGRIAWPKGEAQFASLAALTKAKYDRLDGSFGLIDGLNLPVQESSDPDIQNATYNGWKCACYVSSVLAFAFDGQ
ncbi:hypothetical protein FRB94_000574 [Tulasnella sp. JGI-2019a]|nr:hypothetical protein FRB94_000574 [Tulasnella sp. JGI-2019a]